MNKISKLKKLYTLIIKNCYNLNVHQIFKIFLLLFLIYFIFQNQNKIVFYINNYINLNYFNQLYDLYQLNKSI